jgi:hypothetical protein
LTAKVILEKALLFLPRNARLPFMTRLPRKRGITQAEEDKSPILRSKNECLSKKAVIGFIHTHRENSNEAQIITRCHNAYGQWTGHCASTCNRKASG